MNYFVEIESVAKTETDNLLGKTNSTGPKSLTFDQIIQNYTLWMSSHATNFGFQIDAAEKMSRDEL